MKIYQVDAFTDRVFCGNPAAVCVLEEQREDQWLQSVAAEMNLSETAFLWRMGNQWRLRWFTPTVEVDLCGHATLASAHLLWELGYEEKRNIVRFETRSGLLRASSDGEWIELDFPSEPPSDSAAPEKLLEALKISPRYSGRNRFDFLLELESEEEVRKLAPDYTLLRQIPARGIIVTSLSNSGNYDFLSRFFAPSCGVDEDPVTGSAHCCLGPYWQRRTGRDSFTAYQASKRGGYLRVRVGERRTYISGKAITVLIGDFID